MADFRKMCIEVNPIYHWPGLRNIADIATKGKATMEDVLPGSKWQEGPWELERDIVLASFKGICKASSRKGDKNESLHCGCHGQISVSGNKWWGSYVVPHSPSVKKLIICIFYSW